MTELSTHYDQILYYDLRSRKEKTPLYLLLTLNRVEVSVNYNDIQRAKSNQTCFTYFQSPNEFTIDAFNNLIIVIGRLCAENSMITFIELFQAKPEQAQTLPYKHRPY